MGDAPLMLFFTITLQPLNILVTVALYLNCVTLIMTLLEMPGAESIR